MKPHVIMRGGIYFQYNSASGSSTGGDCVQSWWREDFAGDWYMVEAVYSNNGRGVEVLVEGKDFIIRYGVCVDCTRIYELVGWVQGVAVREDCDVGKWGWYMG